MIHKEVIDVFVNYKDAYKDLHDNNRCINILESNGIGLFTYPDIPINVEVLVKRNFNLFDDEKVLFISDLSLDRYFKEGMIITDCGLLFVIGNEHEVHIYWNDINKVESCGNNLCFYGNFGEVSKLEIDIYKFLAKDSVLIVGDLFVQMFTEMSNAYVNKTVNVKISEDDKTVLLLKDAYASEIKAETIRKYPKEEIDRFKDQSVSKVRNLLIIWSVLAFICFLIGGFMVIITIMFAIPIIIALFSYLSLINKDDDYWEKEYSKLWKNLSDVDKLKTAAKIAGGIFKLFG